MLKIRASTRSQVKKKTETEENLWCWSKKSITLTTKGLNKKTNWSNPNKKSMSIFSSAFRKKHFEIFQIIECISRVSFKLYVVENKPISNDIFWVSEDWKITNNKIQTRLSTWIDWAWIISSSSKCWASSENKKFMPTKRFKIQKREIFKTNFGNAKSFLKVQHKNCCYQIKTLVLKFYSRNFHSLSINLIVAKFVHKTLTERCGCENGRKIINHRTSDILGQHQLDRSFFWMPWRQNLCAQLEWARKNRTFSSSSECGNEWLHSLKIHIWSLSAWSLQYRWCLWNYGRPSDESGQSQSWGGTGNTSRWRKIWLAVLFCSSYLRPANPLRGYWNSVGCLQQSGAQIRETWEQWN